MVPLVGHALLLRWGGGWALCCSDFHVLLQASLCHAQCVWADVAGLFGRVFGLVVWPSPRLMSDLDTLWYTPHSGFGLPDPD